jgi:abequosyltransferase
MAPLLAVNGAVGPMVETTGIKLSICIPTLNRGSFIGETLESIICQATDEVEIVIVDGGSADNTQDVVCQYQQRFPNIRYVRDDPKKGSVSPSVPSNGGFDRDCNRAVEWAKGEYCWLFTDDDLLKRGAIQAVLDATQRHFGFIVVNAEIRNADLSKLLEPKRLQLSADRIYKPTENQSLFTSVGAYLTFVGGVVIRRQLWEAREKEPYIGSAFIHIGVIFQAPVLEDTLVIANPLITIRYGNALYMRTSRYFKIWMIDWPNLVWSLPCFSDSAKRQVVLKEPWRRKRTLLLYRAKGVFSIKEYRDRLEGRLDSRWHRLSAKFIACFPGSIANLIAVIHHLSLGHGYEASLVDLVNSPFYCGRGFKWLRSR